MTFDWWTDAPVAHPGGADASPQKKVKVSHMSERVCVARNGVLVMFVACCSSFSLSMYDSYITSLAAYLHSTIQYTLKW